ncbi:MAG: YbaB/EbfC family nucleoid-associated protein [Candidatus Omnitrophica bacterium]|nr:YbaB/EbfC family nucleoid-associated protein [Candidatus Omnitrophota bacterium]MCM8788180.1 YbaB/EbfC family nucleoid-associated protein [Candidatus Omnitrophota bacterium]
MANMFEMLKQAGQIRKQAGRFQKILESKVCEVSSPDGKISIKVNGKMELLYIDISPEMLSTDNKTRLEKSLLAVWQKAQKEIERIIQEETKNMLGNLGDLPF